MSMPENIPGPADDPNYAPIACDAGTWLTAGVGGCFNSVAGNYFKFDVLDRYSRPIPEDACRQAGRCLLQLPDPSPGGTLKRNSSDYRS